LFLDPACRKYYLTPKKLMASGKGGPNPVGWNKLTPEQVRSTIAIGIGDMSLLADSAWTEEEIGTLNQSKWGRILAWFVWRTENEML
jgi:hypothetical protein